MGQEANASTSLHENGHCEVQKLEWCPGRASHDKDRQKRQNRAKKPRAGDERVSEGSESNRLDSDCLHSI